MSDDSARGPRSSLSAGLESVWVVVGLGAAVVLGTMLLLTLGTRAALVESQRADMSSDVAVIADAATSAFVALQEERDLAELLLATRGAEVRRRYDQAVEETDSRLTLLRSVWTARGREVPDLEPTGFDDVFRSATSLEEIRETALTQGEETTFEAYRSVVRMLLEALTAVMQEAPDPITVSQRSAVLALLNASEALTRRRSLVVGLLNRQEPMSQAESVELSVLDRDARQSLIAARTLAPQHGDRIRSVESGTAAPGAEMLLRAIQEGAQSGDYGVSPSRWYDQASVSVSEVALIAGRVNDDLLAQAAEAVSRSARRLITAGVGLGMLVVLAAAATYAAVRASRERARALEEYGALTAGLREWFLPGSLADVTGISSAARYVPSSERTLAGGDWYDLYQVRPGLLAVVIGDVAGRGPQAAAHMAHVRNLLRGLSIADPLPPGAQLDRLDEALAGSGVFATAIYGLLDLRDGVLLYSRAGHVPMLLAGPGAGVVVLDGGSGPPLGSEMDAGRTDSRVDLEAGCVLVLLTDGLVESPARSLEDGIRAAQALVAGMARDPTEIADALLSLRVDGADDAAVLALKWDPSQ